MYTRLNRDIGRGRDEGAWVVRKELVGMRYLRAWANCLEAHPRLALSLVSLIYFTVTFALAWIKTPWNDEVITAFIARRPTLQDVWHALLTGAEQLPILFYVITRGSVALLGATNLGIRLPEILGFWLMSISIYAFVRRVSSAAWALVAMIFPLITGAYYYAYEARSYGLVLGFSSLALLFWQKAIRGRNRRLPAIGLGASLAGALACHFYAILAFAPLIAAEAFRCWRRRRVDVAVAAAFLLGLAPIPSLLPLIRAAKSHTATFWATPHWRDMFLYYPSMVCAAPQRWCQPRQISDRLVNPNVTSAAFTLDVLLAALPFLWAFSAFSRRRKVAETASAGGISDPEWVAIAGFALTPVLAVVLAMTVTHAYTDRYAIIAVIGMAPMVALGMAKLSRNSPGAAAVAVLIALGLFLAGSRFDARRLRGEAIAFDHILSSLREESAGIPVVITNPHNFLLLSALQEKRPSAAPIRYLFDRERALAYTGTDSVELGLISLHEWAPLSMERFDAFAARPEPVLLFGSPMPYSWVMKELQRQNWTFRPYHGKYSVYLVRAEPPQR